jgi:hypothetical protein
MTKGIADYQNTYDISKLSKAGAFDRGFVEFPFLGLICQRYLIRYRHHNWPKDMSPQLIRVEWTRCHFGGRRPWFLCTYCGKRVGKMYQIMGGLACRTCANLGYVSQCMGKTRRRQIKAERVRRLMGDEGRPAVSALPDRLQGKHRKTHQNKCVKLHTIEAEINPKYRYKPRRVSRWRY